MLSHALAALFVLFVWWASTALVLFINGLPRSTHRYSLLAASFLGAGGLWGLAEGASDASTTGAYRAFVCGLLVWAWHEITFLFGVLTGPRKLPCPPDARGWRRFWLATAAVIHHEVALALTMAAMVALTWGEPNQVGTWTFLVLWTMRLSAKLNVFLGVRNLAVDFIPEHLRYLTSYFRKARANPLMPISILVSSGILIWLSAPALAEGATPFVVVGTTLVATMLALAVLEHLFLALPVPDAVLWRWALRANRRAGAAAAPCPEKDGVG